MPRRVPSFLLLLASLAVALPSAGCAECETHEDETTLRGPPATCTTPACKAFHDQPCAATCAAGLGVRVEDVVDCSAPRPSVTVPSEEEIACKVRRERCEDKGPLKGYNQ